QIGEAHKTTQPRPHRSPITDFPRFDSSSRCFEIDRVFPRRHGMGTRLFSYADFPGTFFESCEDDLISFAFGNLEAEGFIDERAGIAHADDAVVDNDYVADFRFDMLYGK